MQAKARLSPSKRKHSPALDCTPILCNRHNSSAVRLEATSGCMKYMSSKVEKHSRVAHSLSRRTLNTHDNKQYPVSMHPSKTTVEEHCRKNKSANNDALQY